jgi:hypothetical protein
MNLRHTAALALAGWYLMTPSISYIKAKHSWSCGDYGDSGEPLLYTWRTSASYDSAAECEKAKTTLVLRVPDDVRNDRMGYARALSQAQSDAVCIATDDPRLKP